MARLRGGGVAAKPQPLSCGLVDTERIAAASLDWGTAAQIVRLLDEFEVQVSDAIPPGLHAAVARHVLEIHLGECYVRSCRQAREWLPEAPALPGRASLLA